MGKTTATWECPEKQTKKPPNKPLDNRIAARYVEQPQQSEYLKG